MSTDRNLWRVTPMLGRPASFVTALGLILA